jgi:hypothetical protein
MPTRPHHERKETPITVTCPKCHNLGSGCSLCVRGRVTLSTKKCYRKRPDRKQEEQPRPDTPAGGFFLPGGSGRRL